MSDSDRNTERIYHRYRISSNHNATRRTHNQEDRNSENKNRYPDVNKNEVNFRGKIPIDMEYEINQQKMEILITKTTDITPL